ncbi:MAG: hypothetical protein GY935_28050, partial [Gammaproteobacteria bacterium]|nr:hypothetical protein [Gammaproteobacteria bacterium]
TGDAVTLNIDGLTIDNVGNNTSDHGMNLDIDNSATLTGTINNVTIGDSSGAGIFLDARTGGVVNPTFTAITINGPVGTHGMQLIGDSTTTPTLSNININAGQYNLTIQGIGGSFSNMILDGATISSIYFDNNANPSSFDSATITLSNSPSPYTLVGMNLPALVGYTSGAGLVEDYVVIRGPISSNMTILADPLATATGTGQADDPTVSYWYSPASLLVNNSATLTIGPSTLMKFAETTYLQVESTGVLNINGTSGNEVYLTSFSDNAVNDPVTSAAVNNDWYGIYFRTGSSGGT